MRVNASDSEYGVQILTLLFGELPIYVIFSLFLLNVINIAVVEKMFADDFSFRSFPLSLSDFTSSGFNINIASLETLPCTSSIINYEVKVINQKLLKGNFLLSAYALSESIY
jgi:hypothetical protein